ncbi:bifunctional riboflavin kinase/FAD synthetase [Desulfomicrobium sp. ZS1]|jgi:riboflavin kinase/FMN adenylyltransferase|uniref:bifunctional riboflavin kinase/FAD synthetase n=1 Tax=Desulfomicrobium sp. ZS1 TaxID=2952228 RepID=UPI0020B3D9E7|nr:bifunctional riboflavin kinase/FAD synthetase [Desulfomicrobium sp. ZS1]UTF49809.1 bifunctional riboflavin kinase/FAD synthetase [Desulfomicrobium sp. ZS1]
MHCVTWPDQISGLEKGSCVTIGNFDGVHIGHQRLIARVRDLAAGFGLPSVVITFEPHPLRFFTGKKTPPFITLYEQRAELIRSLGIDHLLCLEFNQELASMNPEDFVRRILVEGLHIKELVIGYDYAFGKGRGGNYALLSQLGKQWEFGVEQLEPVMVDQAIVSSTRIRDLVEAGDVWAAKPLLGRFYRVTGTVVHGQNRGGRLLGFPTANVHLVDELFPKTGVYCCWAEFDGEIHQAVANIGFNPTFGNDVLSVEVHVMDFSADLYERTLKVHFVQRLRGERKFSGLDELKAQIGKDVALARTILALPEARLV